MNDGKQVARGEQRAMVILLMTMTLLGVFPLDVVLPSFPDLSDYFRTSPSDIALSVSVFAIGPWCWSDHCRICGDARNYCWPVSQLRWSERQGVWCPANTAGFCSSG